MLIYKKTDLSGLYSEHDILSKIPYRKMMLADIAFCLDTSNKKLILVKNRYGETMKSWNLPDDLFLKLDNCNLPAIYDL